jgi:predicted XRE-type DNA-binding protein
LSSKTAPATSSRIWASKIPINLWRAQIGYPVFKILEDKDLKQREIADVLGIAQPDVSHLMNGHSSRFTLLDFLKRLDRKVTIEVNRHHKGEPANLTSRSLAVELFCLALK